MREQLHAHGWRLAIANSPQLAIEQARSGDFRCGIVFVDRPEHLEWMDRVCCNLDPPNMEWIALASRASLESPPVVEFVAERCFDFHTLPVDIERLDHSLGRAHAMAAISAAAIVSEEVDEIADVAPLVGESSAMQQVFRTISRFAWSELPLLITGENGTGKEHVARVVHRSSRRAGGPFVAVNCAALPPELVQVELFGHEKGVFTDAREIRVGRIEAASGGTILLDEIGDLPDAVQVSLLRFLELGTIERVGGTESIEVNVRVISATHVDLEDAVARGKFREDLYYRVNVLSVQLPPLRRRPEDLPLLASQFLAHQRLEGGVRARGFANSARRAMLQHSWPGNVRELRNRVTQAAVLCEGRLITRADLGLQHGSRSAHLPTLKAARDAAERRAIMASLESSDGNVTRAAEALGVSRIYLYKLLERHALDPRRSG